MGIAKVTLNGVAQIDLTGVTVVAEKLHSGYSAVGADGEPVAGSYTPTPAGYQISIENLAIDASNPATITGIVNNGYYNGVTYFTVACSRPCVVVYTTDGGISYTRLTAVATDINNTYLFSINVNQAMTITVAIKGDFTCDGKLNTTDKTQISRYLNGLRDLPFLPSADVDADGDVDTDDYDLISAAIYNPDAYGWDTVSS